MTLSTGSILVPALEEVEESDMDRSRSKPTPEV